MKRLRLPPRLPRPSELFTQPAPSDPLRVPKGLLQSFFVATALEAGRAGFRRATFGLVSALYFSAAGRSFPLNVVDIQKHAARYGLTAKLDRPGGFVVFRRLFPPLDTPDDFERAAGEILCPACGYCLSDHPADSDLPFLRVRCDGRRFKL